MVVGRSDSTSNKLGECSSNGPTSMRKPLSRSEQDEHGTSQTSIRRHPLARSAMNYMRLLPFTPAASQCAMSDPGMQPKSRSRS